ncbi:BspA family leucine-rich repeat surface protein [Marivirga arenosa]|uniref:BspA family leucine-rich repeat surface protein n=1 Tax=Marivirga arenosa TaxID=3059076 RepID=A0AA51NA04_9BACT|nr:BspA family leucine-rich repeat surface protein [Marivirga sp. ABR2-2]WMN07245.1 BspA family leucine-rich repeat surface protein [Marivirga sp. ABR2-2]
MYILTPLINFSKVSKILLSLVTLLIFQSSFLIAQDRPFITVWQTDNPGSSNDNQITIPGTGTDYLIEWEEVGNEANNNGSETGTDTHTITFPSAGTYRVKINGDFNRINFNNQGDVQKITDIEQWGDISWSSFENAFFNCDNLLYSATDAPDLSGVTNMSRMFENTNQFNGDIDNWDVSTITNMNYMFRYAYAFNQSLNNWDVSSVELAFHMFDGADQFNGDITAWNTSNIRSFSKMFRNASSFNQDISGWSTTSALYMISMFEGAESFNADISNWQTANVQEMTLMFSGATAFDANLGNWDISSITNMSNMLDNSGLSTANYDAIITGWAENQETPQGITLGAANLNYCNSAASRNDLINTYGWTIQDGTNECSTNLPFITVWQTDNPGSSNDNQITIPGTGTDYLIEWEEVGNEANNNGSETGTDTHTITFPSAGTYRVKINGDFNRINFNNQGDVQKITDIEQWGDISWSSFENAFFNCDNLLYSATDAPDLSGVTNMSRMFENTNQFNGDIDNWDVSTITNMNYMFRYAYAFNQSLNNWDVSSVELAFHMFDGADQFNGDITAWNTSNIRSFSKMFRNASSFNQDISGWSTTSALYMISMFEGAESFNADISNWQTANVQEMTLMFSGATAFDANLGNWDISSITNMSNMLDNSGLSTANYDAIITGWAENQETPQGITLGAANLNYCNSAASRNDLINTYGWTIQDGTNECSTNLPFITVWQTDNPGSSNDNQITIPGTGTDYLIEWEEVGNEANNNGSETGTDTHTITFPSAGTYRVKINGDFNRINFNNQGDVQKITDIEQWGDISWSSFENAFFNCDNLLYSATDAPDLSGVTNMSRMFENTNQFNGDIDNWDVSTITNMNYMFRYAYAFNQSLNNWDVSSVELAFHMFDGADQFNGDITAWNTSNIRSFSKMFRNASSFNQDISGWSTTSALYMISMFEGAESFNADISNWQTANVQEMTLMFSGATAFDANLGNWDISSITNMSNMLDNSGLSTANYDATITGWAENQETPQGITLGAANLNYCNSAASRNDLINTYGWTIQDGTNECSTNLPFITVWQTDNPGSSNDNQITIPGTGTDYLIEWEEVGNEANNNGSETGTDTHTITFPSAGTYRVKINGDFNRINFNNQGDVQKITDIEQWGDISWSSFENAFFNCDNLLYSATDAPDLSGVTNMSRMFENTNQFNGDIDNWDVSTITNMNYMFRYAYAFNQSLNNWDVSSVELAFHMFDGADQFNGDITAWNTSNIRSFSKMFRNASSFNQDISGWSTTSALYMISMFEGAESFNADISNWQTANVQEMTLMFSGATAFDANLGNWDISSITNMSNMLDNSGLSTENYDLTLEGWATNGNIPSDIALSAEGLFYCASEEYRQQLINEYGWNITGDETCSIAIQETMPAVEATSVEKTTEIYITFDQEIEEIDLSGITLEDINGTEISLTDIYIDSLTLNLVHSGLGSNTYQVTIPENSIISASGKENETIEWSFTTQRVLSTEDQITNSKYSVFPNPFTDQTNLTFNLNKNESVKLRVYDLKGQLVREETFKNLSSGEQSITFERNDLPSGLYNYQIQSKSGSFGGKMLIK